LNKLGAISMSKFKKLTPEILRQLVLQEKKGLKITSDAEEVDAKDLASSLVNKIDYVKSLKIEEAKLKKKLLEIAAKRQKIKNIIIKEL
tara:strand:- start:204 stop:470 length:267 start_codon:yes stop_codon:yes gene_type:complete